jgi:inner membrane protein
MRRATGELADSAWDPPRNGPLARLRDLAARDCGVRAWLQFGRVPVLDQELIYDLRFDNGTRDNFTAMDLPADPGRAGCPPHLTRWALPRADLLGPAAPDP